MIEKLLEKHADLNSDDLLFELLAVDLELRESASLPLVAGDYLRRFSSQTNVVRNAWEEHLKRHVALKKINQGLLAGDVHRRRFRREAHGC